LTWSSFHVDGVVDDDDNDDVVDDDDNDEDCDVGCDDGLIITRQK